MFNAFAVFLPWLAVALAVSLILCAGQLFAWIARRIRYRAEFAEAVRGRRRCYATTFINHRGF